MQYIIQIKSSNYVCGSVCFGYEKVIKNPL